MKQSWPAAIRTIKGDHDRFEQTYFSTFKARLPRRPRARQRRCRTRNCQTAQGAWRGTFAEPGCTSWLGQVVYCRCLGRWEATWCIGALGRPPCAGSRRCWALLRQQRRWALRTGSVVLQASLRTGARAAGPVLHRRRMQARRARVLHHHGPRGRRHQRVRPPRGHRRGGGRAHRARRVRGGGRGRVRPYVTLTAARAAAIRSLGRAARARRRGRRWARAAQGSTLGLTVAEAAPRPVGRL
jgi:hypothetical protein